MPQSISADTAADMHYVIYQALLADLQSTASDVLAKLTPQIEKHAAIKAREALKAEEAELFKERTAAGQIVDGLTERISQLEAQRDRVLRMCDGPATADTDAVRRIYGDAR